MEITIKKSTKAALASGQSMLKEPSQQNNELALYFYSTS
jgi:hypothetical protein